MPKIVIEFNDGSVKVSGECKEVHPTVDALLCMALKAHINEIMQDPLRLLAEAAPAMKRYVDKHKAETDAAKAPDGKDGE